MKKETEKNIIDAILKSVAADKSIREKITDGITKKGLNGAIKYLMDKNIAKEKEILRVLSEELDIPLINLSRLKFDEKAVNSVPEKIALMYKIVPISKIGDNITVATFDPTDILAIDDLKQVTRCNITIALAGEDDIKKALRMYSKSTISDDKKYTANNILAYENDKIGLLEEDDETFDAGIESNAPPIVKVVSVILCEAIKKRSSDIHIEPEENALRIRYRIDGDLYDIFELSKKNEKAIIARIKIMSKLDITETRLPQDSRFRIKFEEKEIDFRVSVLPTAFGNKIVLRALDKNNLSMGLEGLGFLPESLKDFRKAMEKPYGIILLTGPTGSGKSTTLYSLLNGINVPEKNIVTVEDPVEYQLEGITQMPIRHEIGMTFASGLRSILRQNPDVIMIGEIRDSETADIAVKSSLTGHMVLSTLHTNDSVGAITRLINMGVEPFLISSSLTMTCAQRLLRKICPNCKREAPIHAKILDELTQKYPEMGKVRKFYIGEGCAKCNNTGYYGRMGVLETLIIDDNIRALIQGSTAENEIKNYIKTTGFKTLRENAITKLCEGVTSLDEVLRVT